MTPSLFDTEAAPVAAPPKKKPPPDDGPPVFPCEGEKRLSPGASQPERLQAAADLEGALAEFRAGTATLDELYRTVRGAVYVYTASELEALAVAMTALARL